MQKPVFGSMKGRTRNRPFYPPFFFGLDGPGLTFPDNFGSAFFGAAFLGAAFLGAALFGFSFDLAAVFVALDVTEVFKVVFKTCSFFPFAALDFVSFGLVLALSTET